MLDIQNKIEFEGNCWIGSIDPSHFNSSEEARIKAVTDLASITTGRLGFKEITFNSPDMAGVYGSKLPSNSERRKSLYNRLLKESAGKPSVPFEFIPQIEWEDDKDWSVDFCNSYMKYGYYEAMSGGVFKTNLRNTENFEIGPDAEELKDYSDFKIIVGQVPWKTISHLRTHRAFSWLVESSRNKKYLNEVKFWYPSWWNKSFINDVKASDKGTIDYLQLDIETKRMKPEEATMELSDRRLVYFAMSAWQQDLNSWDNLFAVRGKGTGTQSITGLVVDNIKILVNG